MLTHLQIRDFAIIDAIELELRPGMTVLTGETGAGKSILVDALQLLAGGRKEFGRLRHRFADCLKRFHRLQPARQRSL